MCCVHTHTMLVDVAWYVKRIVERKSLRYCKLEVLEQKAEQEADLAQWNTSNATHKHFRSSSTLMDVTH